VKHAIFFRSVIFLFLPLALSGTALGERHNPYDRMMRDPGQTMHEQMTPEKEPELKTIDDLAKEIRALRQRIAVLEALKPTFTNFMPNFAERFHVAHRAGDAGDWAVAAHEIDEMLRLTRISSYIDPKLGVLMQGFMEGNLRQMREAVEHTSQKSFRAAVKNTLSSCNGCHTAAGSTLMVSLDVPDNLSMRHPHALRKTKVPKDHMH
jgi:hypothetical protein